ncbi:MAG: RHS repeat-associated core domain-containing protein [Candidatus Thiodiazotropha sp.]
MIPSAKHGDPQLGIDIHLCWVPTPAPTPTPLPTPHLSVVFDPFDYVPLFGATVEVQGMKRATAGTGALVIHIPPGFPFAPVPPERDDELFMGSASVVADGDPLSYSALPVLGCQIAGMPSPPRPRKRRIPRPNLLPTNVNLAIPSSVVVGGAPTISLMGLAFAAGFAGLGKLAKSKFAKRLGERFKQFRQKLFKNMDSGFLKCKILRAEPVNILTGAVSMEQSDFTLAGRIPIEWVRSYASNRSRRGACGIGWETPADGRLEFDPSDGSVMFHYPDEGPALFPERPAAEGDAAAVLELMDGARLSDHGDEWRVQTKRDLIFHFPKSHIGAGEDGLQEIPLGRISDRCGNWLAFERTNGRLAAIRESTERYLRFDYAQGYISAITLFVPATGLSHCLARYAYSPTGDLVAARDPLDIPYTFAYDHHHMVRHTNRNGLAFHYEYDQSGDDWKVIHTWGDGGLYDYRFDYWPQIRETRITDSLGHSTTVKCDANGLPILEIDPLGGRTLFAYDEAGRTTAVVNPANHRLAYRYDERGNLRQLTQPDGSAIAIEVNTDNKPVAITDPNGAVWRQAWDERGLMRSRTSPLGAVTRYDYDPGGLPMRITDAHETSTQLGFDLYGALTSVTDAEGNTTRLQRDEQGNLLALSDPLGRTTRYRYDAKSRLIEAHLFAGGRIRYAYDAEDNLIDYEEEHGSRTRFEYRGLDRLAKRLQADGNSVEYHYDTEERLVGVTNQRGERYGFSYDALGRVIEEIDYWGQATRYRFDNAGHVNQRIDPLGQTIDYTPDELGRILRKRFAHPDHPGREFEERFEYDANGNLTGCVNEHTQVQRRFDLEGQLLEEKQGDFVIRMAYDELGRRIHRETGNGHVVAYTYDRLSRLHSIRIDNESPITLERDAAGQLIKEQLSPALQRHYRYDEAGRLTAQGVKVEADWLFQTQYAYDPVGNLIQRNDSHYGIDHYKYDPLGQIIEHIDPQGRLKRFLQDPAGDRLATRVVEMPSRQVVGGEEIPGAWYREGDYEGVHYRFDGAGNLRLKRDRSITNRDGEPPRETRLSWDANQRLVRSESNGVETHYGYDPLGRRVFKQTGAKQTRFGWDGDALIAEWECTAPDEKIPDAFQASPQTETPTTQAYREYLYYPGSFAPLALIKKHASYRYHTEPNGCPTRLLDTDGTILWSASYEVWGRADVGDVCVDNRLRMQGQYHDAETGLYYNRHRYYDPDAGQFVSQDPIGLLGGVNHYQYAPNGFDWIDPLGLSCTPDILPSTGCQTVDLRGNWRATRFANQGDSLVYILRDADTGELLKVGKTSVSKFNGRFAQYDKAAKKTGRNLEADVFSFKADNFTAESIEKEIRDNFVAERHRLPWDNTNQRLGREGPGTPGASIPRRLRRKNMWDYKAETLVPRAESV